MTPRILVFAALALAAGAFAWPRAARAQQGTEVASAETPTTSLATAKPPASAPAAAKQDDGEMIRIEGQRRFHANCGRCHQSPHKFPPRMMATIVRHMRVRATITDEDMRVILRFMTQ